MPPTLQAEVTVRVVDGDTDPDDTILVDLGNRVDGVETAVGGKAPLDSPAFEGAPTAPTPLLADNGTRIATTAFVVMRAEKVLDSETTVDTAPGSTELPGTKITVRKATEGGGFETAMMDLVDVVRLIRNPDVAGGMIHQRWSMGFSEEGAGSFTAAPLPLGSIGVATGATENSTGNYTVTIPPVGALQPFEVLFFDGFNNGALRAKVSRANPTELTVQVINVATGVAADWNGTFDVLLYSPLE